MGKKIDFVVRVSCMTYNHESYIEDAMNGFVMQQTDFPFLAIVVDDASTDGEPEVIKNYLTEHFDKEALDLPTTDETDEYVRVFARHKENKNCYFLVMFLKYNHYSIKKAKLTSIADLIRPIPYIALCEGDDYWTDPLKLQKQVEFMEGHEECGLCFTNYRIRRNNNENLSNPAFEEITARSKSFEEHLLSCGYIAPMTWVYRQEFRASFVIEESHTDGSFALALEFFQRNWVCYLDEVTAVYRIHSNSASHQLSLAANLKYKYGVFQTQMIYANKFHREDLIPKIQFEGYIRLYPLAMEAQNDRILDEIRQYFISIERDYEGIEAIVKENIELKKIRKSHAYKLGKRLLKPFSYLRNKFS